MTELESPTPKDDDVQETYGYDLRCDVVVAEEVHRLIYGFVRASVF